MNIYDQANADNRSILTDLVSGFGVSITVTRPDGTSTDVVGMAADIGLTIDPDSGQAVSGRRAHCTIDNESLAALGVPTGVMDAAKKPWTAAFKLPSEQAIQSFKITEVMPDRLGCSIFWLEAYQ